MTQVRQLRSRVGRSPLSKLRELRVARGWSHAELADRLGVSYRTAYRLIAGPAISPHSLTLMKIRRLLERERKRAQRARRREAV